MKDPITALAFSIYENKGVYCLLLGSGVSRPSEIPTGWEITLDLVSRVAALQGAKDEPDWAKWYKATFQRIPSCWTSWRARLTNGGRSCTATSNNDDITQPQAGRSRPARIRQSREWSRPVTCGLSLQRISTG